MPISGTDLDRLIERARREEAGALGRLLHAYRNHLRLLARTGLDASLQGKAKPVAPRLFSFSSGRYT